MVRSPPREKDGDQRRLRELDAERRGGLPESFADEMERHYSPGRTWQSLAVGLAALLRLGDVLDVGSGDGAAARLPRALLPLAHLHRHEPAHDRGRAASASRRYPHVRAAGRRRARAAVSRDASFDSRPRLSHADVRRAPAARARRVRARPAPGRAARAALASTSTSSATSRRRYGERHPGFSPRALRALLVARRARRRSLPRSPVARAKKPHFQVVLAIAEKPHQAPSKNAQAD